MEDVCYQFSVRIEETLLPQAGVGKKTLREIDFENLFLKSGERFFRRILFRSHEKKITKKGILADPWPQVAINHLLIFILIRTISVFRLIRTKNPSQRPQPAIKKPQLQYSHPALNIYHIKNKYKNNQIKSFASFRSAWLDSDQTSAVRRRPRRPGFSSSLSPSWDSSFESQKFAQQSRRLWRKIRTFAPTLTSRSHGYDLIPRLFEIRNFHDHLIQRQNWRLQTDFECVGVFFSRDIAI